jgi:hypothetical protein
MEIWKDIPQFEGVYQASNLGKIKRVIAYKKPPGIIKLRKTCNGYMQCCISFMGVKKYYLAHRLVISAFVGIENKDVDHINSDRTDNRIENLRYCTKRENSHFRYEREGSESIYRGVTRHNKKWRVRISVNGKQIRLGTYLTQEEAASVYNNYLKNI